MNRGTVSEYLKHLKGDTLVCVVSEVMKAPYYWLTSKEAQATCNDDINCREVTSTGFYTVDGYRWLVITIDDYTDDDYPDLSYYWNGIVQNKFEKTIAI